MLVLQRISDEDQSITPDAEEDFGASASPKGQSDTEAAPAGSAGSDDSADAVVNAVVSEADAAYLGDEDDEEEDEGRELWVGSPY